MAVKACTLCLAAAAGVASCNSDFLGAAPAVLIEITVCCLASYADILAGMAYYSICHALASLPEAFTAGFIGLGSVIAANGDITLGTEMFLIVHAVFHRTFELSHFKSPFLSQSIVHKLSIWKFKMFYTFSCILFFLLL